MPEPPAHNPTISPLPALRTDPEDDIYATITFLPPLVSRTLIAAWILLLSSRWLIVEGLIAVGFFGPDLPQNLDRIDKIEKIDAALGRCYLFLLSVTLVILVLRIVHGLRSERAPGGSTVDFNAQRGSVSAGADAGKTEASDREANRRD